MMKIVFISLALVFIGLVYSTPIPQRGYGSNGFYYPSFWYSRTNYDRYNRYRYARQLLDNLKVRSSSPSYAEIGSAWGR